ncbi:MAG TPA: hypothetical protein VFR22_16990 [Nocardioidaceae bacterium]|nr:hypothetical protein [Nocardioidaceae bacterium]
MSPGRTRAVSAFAQARCRWWAQQGSSSAEPSQILLGTSGVRKDGTVTDTTVIEVPVKRAMIAAADRAVLLADASKFPGKSTARICGPTDLDALVTNADADPDTLSAFRENGVDIYAA